MRQKIGPVITLLQQCRNLIRLSLCLLEFFVGRVKFLNFGAFFSDDRIQPINFLLLIDRQLLKQKSYAEGHQHQTEYCRDKIGLLLVHRLPAQRAVWHQVHFHRTCRQITQAEADYFAQSVRYARQLFKVDGRVNLHVAERVEILHWHV